MTRRQALALSLAGFAIAPGANSAIAQSPLRYPSDLIPKRDSLARLGLMKSWSASAPLFGTERLLNMNLAGTTVFAQTNMGNLHAYEAETGKYLWAASLGERSLDAKPVSVNSDHAFVTSGPYLNALDLKTGRMVWKTRMEASAVGATAASEEQVMVGLTNGRLAAYNVRDHTKDKTPGRSAGAFAFAWQTNATISARPVPAGRVIAFASQDARVYVALDKPPQILFRFATGGPIIGSMGTYGTRTLIVPSSDRTLYAIDLFTGETKWTIASGSPFLQEPLVDHDTVIAINKTGRLMGIDAKTGEIKRSAESGGGQLISLGEARAYFESADGDLAIFDRTAGRVLFSPRDTREGAGLNLREYALGITNAENDRLYFGTHSGFLLCLREIGQEQPRTLRDPKAPKFGYLPPDGEGEAAIPTPPDAPTEVMPDSEPNR